MASTCSTCGTTITADQPFCSGCGAPVGKVPEQKKRGQGCLGCLGSIVLGIMIIGVLGALGSRLESPAASSSSESVRSATTEGAQPAVPGNGAQEEEPIAASSVIAHTSVRANFRSGPSTDFTPYLKIEPGESVTLSSVHQAKGETWYRAGYGELTGWLSSTVLDVGEQAAADLPSFGAVVEAAQAGDEAVQTYLGTTAFNMQLIAEAMGNFGVLFTDPRPLDKDWVKSVQAQFLAIRVAHRMQSEIDPVPESVVSLQEQVVDTTGTCEQMTYPLEEGMLALDVDRIQEALPISKSCENKVTALMVQLKAAIGDE
ncbi:MAG: hypothetical protein HGA45_26085 [Chloroflexales bacterium]|nr:hypothetical protein [Chloroflexales bacterium]